MTRMRLLIVSFVILAVSVMVFAGIASTHHTQTAGFLSASTMTSLVGGVRLACVGTFVGLGLGLLASAAVIAATAGAAGPAVIGLAVSGAYAPLLAGTC